MSVATKPVYNLRNDAFLGTNEQFNKKLLMLASMAKEENWNFKSLEYKKVIQRFRYYKIIYFLHMIG